jgi:glycosyltransferase involved in cell wall biosynthesis
VRIAIVVPIRDEARWLPRFLGSLGDQERPPHEIVLVDDGSSDGSGDLASALTVSWPHARTVRLPPHPPATGVEAPAIRTFARGIRAIRARST